MLAFTDYRFILALLIIRLFLHSPPPCHYFNTPPFRQPAPLFAFIDFHISSIFSPFATFQMLLPHCLQPDISATPDDYQSFMPRHGYWLAGPLIASHAMLLHWP